MLPASFFRSVCPRFPPARLLELPAGSRRADDRSCSQVCSCSRGLTADITRPFPMRVQTVRFMTKIEREPLGIVANCGLHSAASFCFGSAARQPPPFHSSGCHCFSFEGRVEGGRAAECWGHLGDVQANEDASCDPTRCDVPRPNETSGPDCLASIRRLLGPPGDRREGGWGSSRGRSLASTSRPHSDLCGCFKRRPPI